VHERCRRQTDRETDRQTDRRTDGRATAYSEREREFTQFTFRKMTIWTIIKTIILTLVTELNESSNSHAIIYNKPVVTSGKCAAR